MKRLRASKNPMIPAEVIAGTVVRATRCDGCLRRL
jgi:hypothetical protein